MVTVTSVDSALASIAMGARAGQLEGDALEFKQPVRDPKETLRLLADAAVCFANARGGDIVLGVDDKASGPDAFVDVPRDLGVDIVRKGIFDRTRPSLTCFVVERQEHGRRLMVISVPPAVGTCSNSAGLATRRMGTECLPFTPDQQREVLASRGLIDWTAEATTVRFDELAALEIERLRQLLRRAGRQDLASLATTQLLTDLRLVAGEDTVNRAGALLLAPPERLAIELPEYGYSYQYRATSGAEASYRLRGRDPMLAAIELLIDAVGRRSYIEPFNLPGGVQLSLSDYPIDAVRELIVNGLIHRSYETHGTVDIEHTGDQLTISSPGGFVAGVSPDNILTYPSTPRNRLLTETVALLQLAERTGQGIDRAYREMLRNGKEPPTFRTEQLLVQATLAGGTGNKSFVRYITELPEALARDVEVLLALSVLRRKRTVDALALAETIQRSPAEAQRVLQRMTEARITEPTRRTAQHPTPTYRLRSEAVAGLARALAYRRRQIDASDDKVLEHIREYGFITNKTVQRMFDIDVYRARNLLADMRARRLIAKIGDARGGPGVRYGFPEET
ncbi:MAG TPA: ATP-binding protein [Acidimicrobiales bacterium]|nr:ATP-binding protein [Acidimicrobiales bacterium]